jgi:hypothetical protein
MLRHEQFQAGQAIKLMKSTPPAQLHHAVLLLLEWRSSPYRALAFSYEVP